MDITSQKTAALKILTETLKNEKPVIVHDAHDSGDYILMLKGLSTITLDQDSHDPAVMEKLQDGIARYLKSIEQVLPFLHQNGLLSDEFDFHTMHIDGRALTGITVPGGKTAVDKVEALYTSLGVASPFALMTTGADTGMIEMIAQLQGIGAAGGRVAS